MNVFSRFLKHFSATGWTPELVSAIAFALLGPAVGVLMNTQRSIIYGAALGLTILIWVVAIHLARSAPPPQSPSQGTLPALPSPVPPDPVPPPPKSAIRTQATPTGSGPKRPRAPSSKKDSVVIHGPVQGPIIISQGQEGGQVAQTINNYGPPKRQIQPAARSQMLSILKEATGCIAFASTQGDIEAHEFKALLMGVFSEAGWTVQDNLTFMFFGEHKGLVLTIPFGATEDGPVQTVARALQITGNPIQGNQGDMARECGIYIQVWHAP